MLKISYKVNQIQARPTKKESQKPRKLKTEDEDDNIPRLWLKKEELFHGIQLREKNSI